MNKERRGGSLIAIASLLLITNFLLVAGLPLVLLEHQRSHGRIRARLFDLHLHSIQRHLKELGCSVGAFSITKSPTFVDRYVRHRAAIRADIAQLKTFCTNDLSKQRSVKAIEGTTNEVCEVLARCCVRINGSNAVWRDEPVPLDKKILQLSGTLDHQIEALDECSEWTCQEAARAFGLQMICVIAILFGLLMARLVIFPMHTFGFANWMKSFAIGDGVEESRYCRRVWFLTFLALILSGAVGFAVFVIQMCERNSRAHEIEFYLQSVRDELIDAGYDWSSYVITKSKFYRHRFEEIKVQANGDLECLELLAGANSGAGAIAMEYSEAIKSGFGVLEQARYELDHHDSPGWGDRHIYHSWVKVQKKLESLATMYVLLRSTEHEFGCSWNPSNVLVLQGKPDEAK